MLIMHLDTFQRAHRMASASIVARYWALLSAALEQCVFVELLTQSSSHWRNIYQGEGSRTTTRLFLMVSASPLAASEISRALRSGNSSCEMMTYYTACRDCAMTYLPRDPETRDPRPPEGLVRRLARRLCVHLRQHRVVNVVPPSSLSQATFSSPLGSFGVEYYTQDDTLFLMTDVNTVGDYIPRIVGDPRAANQ
ncbi:hypothetical protein C8Q72DRAFT_218326 [Fomitopsis betulina]|nr:hypothetical protein C8Q72DRAFT_218326 [Fomitopsis betulina]